MTTEQEVLLNIVNLLSEAVKKAIADLESEGTLEPEKEAHYSWKVDEFEYTSEGVKNCKRQAQLAIKESWWKASVAIAKSVKQSNTYDFTLDWLKSVMEVESTAAQAIDSLLSKLTNLHIPHNAVTQVELEELAQSLLKDILDEPVMNGARVALDGIVVLAEKVEFKIADIRIVLRRVERDDLEFDTPAYTPMPTMHAFLDTPTAILDVEFLGRKMRTIQTRIEQAIAVLRLFKTGSVKYLSYQTRSTSLIAFGVGGILTAGPLELALTKVVITEDDARWLKGFWEAMLDNLPPRFYEIGNTSYDYATIAYKRYCDALLHNGVMERRIANAVMTLECLFLKGGETQELLYRLSIRVARIFSLIGIDPHYVKRTLQEAYRIRSLFVHGDQLSYKTKQKLNVKYGSINSFLLTLLDYCRMSILIALMLKKEKGEYVDLIDNALIDSEETKKLERLLNTIKHVIIPATSKEDV